MPRIQSSTDLRNNYNEISTFCHTSREPVFITKNGRGDLAVMSMATYEELSGIIELRHLLRESRAAVNAGDVYPTDDVFREVLQEIADGQL